MKLSFHSFAAAIALCVVLASPAFADRLHARIEGPDADGVTYTARVHSFDPASPLDPWGFAEGVVDGKPRSVLIRFQPTCEPGVYRFTRTWPLKGHWMVRLSLGHQPPAPATVASLRQDGTVKDNKLYSRSDGSRECWKVLAQWMDPDLDDGC